ncbi:MAG: beta-phosphoglucomutase [Pseudomonadota bacterium]
MRLAAVIFDLDGVLADTAQAHFEAWRRLAGELGSTIDEALGERLKGIDRMGALDIILSHGGIAVDEAQRHALAARKNAYYRAAIAAMGPADLLPGAREALAQVKAAGCKTALASASRNAPFLLERLGIGQALDHVVDAGAIAYPKPAPDIFLAAAAALEVAPQACLGVEDAAAGVAAIKAAGMKALGIGDAAILHQADWVLPSIARFRVADFSRL